MSKTMWPTSTVTEAVPLACWTQGIKRSALQDMLVEGTRPDVLSLALGLPAAEMFPVEEYGEAVAAVLDTDSRALQYGPPFEPLKKHVVALMAERGVRCRQEQVFLTTGAQQGVNLLARLLLDPGGQVLIEEMTYTGFQQVLQPYQPEILTVPTDLRTGMDVEAVEALLESGARPSLIYCVTDGHNPLAVSMSRAKRERLVQLACEYRVPVIEDDPYGFLYYEDAPAPPLRALDEQWVYYVGTFSKILAPALRAGWMIVPEEFIPYLSTIKEASDINMSPLSQRAIAAYLEAGHLPAHLARLRREYKTRRDAMSDSLEAHLSRQARWQRPANGMFIWVELPETVDAGELFKAAIKREKVAFIPGQAFSVGGQPRATNCMRLNFSNNSAGLIEEGIARLARVLKSEMG